MTVHGLLFNDTPRPGGRSPRARQARLVVTAAAVLLAGGFVALAPAAAAPPTRAAECPAAAGDARAAARAAASCAGRVEVMSERSEEGQVFANPDGTHTLEQTLWPRFARRGDGWVTADATLRSNPDGTLSPTAPVFPMAFSGGGKGPLASMERDGSRLQLTWPTALPEPTVAGSVATYPDVPVPGVDLQIRARAAGFSTVFVVKTRQAGASAAMASLRFGLGTGGLRMHADPASGALRAVNDAGRVVFSAGTPVMWDSSARIAPGAEEGAAAPAEPKMAPMAVRLAADSVTVTPDQAMLTDSRTEYPVFVDPPWTGYRQNWTIVRKTFPTSSYWNTTSTASDDSTAGAVKVGFEDFESPAMTDRSLFQMRTDGVGGREIVSAFFILRQLWASKGCGGSGTPVYLWTTGAISASTTWNQQPSWSTKLSGTSAVHRYNGSGGCAPADVSFNVQPQVQAAANASAASINLGLKADNETDHWTWKRYQLTGSEQPKLVITYQTKPQQPVTLWANGAPCAVGVDRPAAPAAPVLSASVFDDDGDSVTLTAQWAPVNLDGTYGTWTTIAAQPSATVGYPYSTRPSVTPSPSPFTSGQAYAWRAKATDSTGRSSDYSLVCEFVVDTSGPPAPTVSSPDGSYPESPVECAGGPGTAGTFQLTPNATDVTAFIYQWGDGPQGTMSVDPGETLTLKLTPPPPDPAKPLLGGQAHLYVSSRDAAGHVSTGVYDYLTILCDAAPVIAWWTMSEGSGTSLADSSGNGQTVTHSAGTWTSSANRRVPDDPAISLAGSATASTAANVLNTSKNFSVSAWVRLTSTATSQTVVSQDGHSSGFTLGFRTDSPGPRWVMRVWGHNGIVGGSFYMSSPGTPTAKAGVWTHLVGVYDGGGVGRVRLYVNGEPVTGISSGRKIAINVAGPLIIGRGKTGGVQTDFFTGDVHDVRAHSRVLADAEIRAMARTMVGAWGFEDGPPTAFDASPYGNHANWFDPFSATPATEQVPGHSVDLGTGDGSSFAVRTNGTSGSVDSTDTVVRTNQSFTVSAWVKLASTSVTQIVVSENISNRSTFNVYYNVTSGKWTFDVSKGDSSGWWRATANAAATAHTWYHLVGVYDAQAAEVRLYVGQAANAPALQTTKATAVTTPLASTSLLRIGRAWNGTYLNGTVDDVVVWAGVLSAVVITNPDDEAWRIWS